MPRAQPTPASPRVALARTRTLQRGALRAPPVFAVMRGPAWLAAKSVGTYVPKLTQKSFQKYGFATAVLLTDWATIAGPDLARDTVPERLKWHRTEPDSTGDETARGGATLVLRVDPARALDISYKQRQIVERINTYFGYRAIADLRIIQSPVTRSAETASRVTYRVTAEPGKPATPLDPLAEALARLEAGIMSGSR